MLRRVVWSKLTDVSEAQFRDATESGGRSMTGKSIVLSPSFYYFNTRLTYYVNDLIPNSNDFI